MSAGINVIGDKAIFYIDLPTMPENADKIIPQFEHYFAPSFAKEITQEQLTKSINYYVGRKMMFRRLSSINQAYYLGHSFYFYNDINYDEKFIEKFKNVTLKEVKTVAEKYLKPENTIEIYVR